jgi:TonB family protein
MRIRALVTLVAVLVAGAAVPVSAQQEEIPKRVRIGGNILQRQLERQVAPVYPEVARQARLQGTVRLTIVVGKDGSVMQIEVLSGHPLLAESAMEAVREWRYRPTRLNNEPVEVVSTVDVVFTLGGSAAASAMSDSPASRDPSPFVPADQTAAIASLRAELAAAPDDAARRQRLGNALVRHRELDAGIVELRESLRLQPDDADGHLGLAETLLRQKFDYYAAVAEYREALQRRPDNGRACRALGLAHEFVYDYAQAAQQYSECARANPADVANAQILALALYRAYPLERATAEFRKHAEISSQAGELHKQMAEALQSRNYPAALAQSREALRIQPGDEAEHQRAAFLEASLIEAREKLARLRAYITRSPQDNNGYEAMAYLLHRDLADHASALAVLLEMTAILPQADSARLAEEAAEAKGFDGAIAHLRGSARSQPESVAVRQGLGELLLRKGSVAEATEVLREAARLAPEDGGVRLRLAEALAAGGSPDSARAELQVARGIRAAPRAAVHRELIDIMNRGSAAATRPDGAIVANETSAIGALRTLNTALLMYQTAYKSYAPSLTALGPGDPATAQGAGLIDGTLASGAKNGYQFVYAPGSADAQGRA